MIQQVTANPWQAEARNEETKQFIKDIKRLTRRKFTTEEKIRIVLEGFGRDTPIRDFCHREGIKPSTYDSWLKDFMEAGKERLTRDAARDDTRQEIDGLKRENTELNNQTDLTWGNLSAHTSKLEDAGYLEVEKISKRKRPNITLKLTSQGRQAFRDYAKRMKQVFQDFTG